MAPVACGGRIAGDLDAGRLRPFEAEYEQMGFPFSVRLERGGPEADPVFSFQMTVSGPNGVGIDHVGHRAADLAFVYRKFEFGAFGSDYLDARSDAGRLTLRRMALDGEEPAERPDVATLTPEHAVSDGTFAYWLLGLAPLAPGETWRLNTWAPTAAGLEERATAPFRVVGREHLESADGREWNAWRVEAEGERVHVRNWVVAEPPYLLRQEMAPPGGAWQPVIELIRLRR